MIKIINLHLFYALVFKRIITFFLEIIHLTLFIFNAISIKSNIKKINSDTYKNIDAIDCQLDNIIDLIKSDGLIFLKKIDGTSLSDVQSNAFTKINIKSNKVDSELTPNLSYIKNGTYYLKIKNIRSGKKYLITIIPKIGINYSSEFDGSAGTPSDTDIPSNYNNSDYRNTLINDENTVKSVMPPSVKLEDSTKYPYTSRKQTSIIDISIKNDIGNYTKISSNLGEICEIAQVHSGYFWKGSTYHTLYVPGDRGCLTYTSTYGGKSHSSNPFFFIVKSGKTNEINIKIGVFDDIDCTNSHPLNNKSLSCLSEIVVMAETYHQDRQINQAPQEPSNINNPELDYGDGGERYYEPWKFWFEGDLGSDKNSGASWYKKWKSWFKKKVKNHNDRLDGNGTEDIDAWMEDNKHKGDHL